MLLKITLRTGTINSNTIGLFLVLSAGLSLGLVNANGSGPATMPGKQPCVRIAGAQQQTDALEEQGPAASGRLSRPPATAAADQRRPGAQTEDPARELLARLPPCRFP